MSQRVKIIAADFNGGDFDGSPFDHFPTWLVNALNDGRITIRAEDRDYALWAVETAEGVVIAEPGDVIVCRDPDGESAGRLFIEAAA